MDILFICESIPQLTLNTKFLLQTFDVPDFLEICDTPYQGPKPSTYTAYKNFAVKTRSFLQLANYKLQADRSGKNTCDKFLSNNSERTQKSDFLIISSS